jgi:hypothetical protein
MGVSRKTEEWAKKRSWLEQVYATPPGAFERSASCNGQLLPSFFVIGPPRTGTTWLHEVLKEHTILPFPTKETRFFDRHFYRGLDWYRSHFSRVADGRRVGEIAPTYFASTEAAERIARVVPNSKVVCVFRDPVQRVLSLYKVKRAYGLIPWTFEQAMERDPEMWESSRYASRLKNWQSVLGKEQVLVTFFEDLCMQSQGYLDNLVDFIGVPRFPLTASQGLRVHASETMTHPRSYQRTRGASTMADWFKARRMDRLVAAVRDSPLRKLFLGGGAPFSEVPRETILRLYQLFRCEVEELETMLNRDLSFWKTTG